MKHLLPFFALILMLSTHAVGQETYEILRIYNAQSITIGNRQKKAGDTFKSTDQIAFTSDRQSFKAQKKGTSKAYYFNKKAMEAKKSNTLKDYFANDYHKAKGSTRELSGNVPTIFKGVHNATKYPEKRIALVIGNGNYKKTYCLPNALNDARDLSDRLKQLGFDVMTLYDGDINDMQTTVNSFFQLAQSYQVALIYFAGHGLRYEGKDYLLSVDREDLSIKDECSLEYLIDESEKWKSNGKVMIFVIDACRNRKGFSDDDRVPSAKRGTAILQSTSSGEEAMDADAGSSNSPFATAFINRIGQTGNDLEEEFLDIRREVKNKEPNQVPRISLGGGYNFHFCRGCNTSTPQSQTKTINSNSKTTSNTHQQETYLTAQLAEFNSKGREEFNKQNYSEAVKWFRLAAEQGYAWAQCNLGYCYQEGYGVNTSYSEAVKWYRLAAEQGYAAAQYNLGRCYYREIGVKQSYSKAVRWFRLAAKQGDADAQYILGYCYDKGYGVFFKSYTKAMKWYRLAAEQGNADAQYELGRYYESSTRIPHHYYEAKKWYRLAAEQGHEGAKKELKKYLP